MPRHERSCQLTTQSRRPHTSTAVPARPCPLQTAAERPRLPGRLHDLERRSCRGRAAPGPRGPGRAGAALPSCCLVWPPAGTLRRPRAQRFRGISSHGSTERCVAWGLSSVSGARLPPAVGQLEVLTCHHGWVFW